MTKQELRDRYPTFFEHVYCGWDCGDGWNGLIEQVCRVASSSGVPMRIAQLKEKFGGLRFYYDITDPDWDNDTDFSGTVSAAETASYWVCEKCGTTEGVTTEGGWIRTLCGVCRGT